MRDVQGFFRRYITAVRTLDFETVAEMSHPEFTTEYPQSGERMVGVENMRAIFEHYPGTEGRGPAIALEPVRVIGEGERWVLTPGYTVVPAAGGAEYTLINRTRYPDGTDWWTIQIVELRDEKVYRTTIFFAPEFDPPEWRRPYVVVDQAPGGG